MRARWRGGRRSDTPGSRRPATSGEDDPRRPRLGPEWLASMDRWLLRGGFALAVGLAAGPLLVLLPRLGPRPTPLLGPGPLLGGSVLLGLTVAALLHRPVKRLLPRRVDQPAARTLLTAVLAAAAAVGCLAVARPDPRAVTVSACVERPPDGSSPHPRAACDAPEAYGRVVRLAGPEAAYAPDHRAGCPDDTDDVVNVRTVGFVSWRLEAACVVALRAPHAGAPGGGGGMIRAGDCVRDPDFDFGLASPEVPCTAPEAFGQVLARVDAASACPAGTRRTTTLLLDDREVLCLG